MSPDGDERLWHETRLAHSCRCSSRYRSSPAHCIAASTGITLITWTMCKKSPLAVARVTTLYRADTRGACHWPPSLIAKKACRPHAARARGGCTIQTRASAQLRDRSQTARRGLRRAQRLAANPGPRGRRCRGGEGRIIRVQWRVNAAAQELSMSWPV